MVIVDIRIELKTGVADPEGENTKKALELLGFENIRQVRSMKLFKMDLDMGPDEAMEACEQMCRKLLANPVIQTYNIQIR